MVRQASGRDSDLPPGVTAVAGDFDKPETLQSVLQGVDRVFLVTNSTERTQEQQLRFVEAANRAGVQHIVYLSQLHAAKDSPVRFLRYHAVVEEAIEKTRMAYTHLRPNLYMQGLLSFQPLIAKEGWFGAPVGDARVSAVDVRDIAAVAAEALSEPVHEGRTYDLTGPQALTHLEMAKALSTAMGLAIEFRDTPESTMRGALLSFGMPEWQADGLLEDYAHYRRGEAAGLSEDVLRVTGAKPRNFQSFAQDYRDAFLKAA
jgi:uncharacterized protein YbjT (DUF2867 family)